MKKIVLMIACGLMMSSISLASGSSFGSSPQEMGIELIKIIQNLSELDAKEQLLKAKTLIDLGADLSAEDPRIQKHLLGKTPLHWAAEEGAFEIAKLIIQKNKKTMYKHVDSENDNGPPLPISPLPIVSTIRVPYYRVEGASESVTLQQFAKEAGRLKIFKFILNEDIGFLDTCREQYSLCFPLAHSVAQAGDIDKFKHLYKIKPSSILAKSYPNSNIISPLLMSILSASPVQHRWRELPPQSKISKFIIEKAPDEIYTVRKKDGTTPLTMAIYNPIYEVVADIIRKDPALVTEKVKSIAKEVCERAREITDDLTYRMHIETSAKACKIVDLLQWAEDIKKVN